MENKNILIVSCFFGKSNVKVYAAPAATNCYFFSNNGEIKSEAEIKGWSFIKIDFPLQDDTLESALQAKYVKFLMFLNDYPEFKKFDKILYYDHKVFIKDGDVSKLLIVAEENPNTNIIIRRHERYRKTIFDEIEEASGQERYQRHMKETIEFVNDKIKNDGVLDETPVCNTGLILYYNYKPVLPLTNDVYNTCTSLKQPECQVIWSVLSQKYADKITIIDFHSLIQPDWAEPFTNMKQSNNLYWMLLFCFLFLVLFLYFYFNKDGRFNFIRQFYRLVRR
jgi:hypothetical protein